MTHLWFKKVQFFEGTFVLKSPPIGLFNKSIDGGFPVFDKLLCEKCKAEYITYSRVREYYNSLYYVILNGILREK